MCCWKPFVFCHGDQKEGTDSRCFAPLNGTLMCHWAAEPGTGAVQEATVKWSEYDAAADSLTTAGWKSQRPQKAVVKAVCINTEERIEEVSLFTVACLMKSVFNKNHCRFEGLFFLQFFGLQFGLQHPIPCVDAKADFLSAFTFVLLCN